MKNIIILSLLFIISITCIAQREIEIEGMHLRYELKKDSIFCFLSAPTQGWVMLGFNDKNSTQQADFKFFAVKNKEIVYSDRKNTSGRTYPSDLSLSGENNLRIHYYKETSNTTVVAFSFPLKTTDQNDFQHSLSQEFWLILAYSVADDFEHHSRIRKHLPFKWEPQ